MSGFKFRKRVKLLPGVWLNLSKTGVSTSVGTKGLTVNLKGNKARTTVSAPGTGLSYSTAEDVSGAGDGSAPRERTSALTWICLALLVGLAYFIFA